MRHFNFNIKNEVLNAHPELLELPALELFNEIKRLICAGWGRRISSPAFSFDGYNAVRPIQPALALELWNVEKGRALISYTIARRRGYYAVNFTIK